MPEMPDVVSGEPVASAWGNDIRDRTAQRYPDATQRDAQVPLPIAGDLAWLDSPGVLTVFDGTVWLTLVDITDGDGRYVNITGDVMTGALSQAPDALVRAPAVGGVIQRWNGDGDGASRHYEWRRAADFGALELYAIRSSGEAVRVLVVPANNDGDRLNLTNGLEITKDDPTIYSAAVRRIGLFTTFSVWSDTNGWLRLRVGADDTTSYLVRFYSRDGQETPIYSFTETGMIGPGTQAGSQINYAEQIETLQTQLAALEAVVAAL